MKVELQNLLKYDDKSISVAKREVIRMIGKIYGPIGILNSLTVTAKILVQEIWKEDLNWKDELNEDMHNKCSKC